MFGITPLKLIILAVIIGAVIYGPRLLRRLDKFLRTDTNGGGEDDAARAIDTQQCKACGDYVVPSSAGDCGRAECPYG